MICGVCIFISYPIFLVSPNSWEITWNWQGGEAPQQSRKPSRAKRFSTALLLWSRPSPRQRRSEAEKTTTNRIYFGDHHLDEGESSGETSLVEDLLHCPPPWHVLLWSIELAVLNWEPVSYVLNRVANMDFCMTCLPSRAWSFQGLSPPGNITVRKQNLEARTGGASRWQSRSPSNLSFWDFAEKLCCRTWSLGQIARPAQSAESWPSQRRSWSSSCRPTPCPCSPARSWTQTTSWSPTRGRRPPSTAACGPSRWCWASPWSWRDRCRHWLTIPGRGCRTRHSPGAGNHWETQLVGDDMKETPSGGFNSTADKTSFHVLVFIDNGYQCYEFSTWIKFSDQLSKYVRVKLPG